MNATVPSGGTLREAAGAIFLIFAIFFLNMLSRLGLSPLMPVIEADLGLNHAAAGSLFLFLSAGYGSGLFSALFVSARFTHHRVIAASSMATGGALVLATVATGLPMLRAFFFVLGFSGGLYLPSGIATLTFRVRRQDWGKVLAIHQLAPNLAYICAPGFAAAAIGRLSWHDVLMAYGVAAIGMGVVYLLSSRSDGYRGAPPQLAILKALLKTPALWIMVMLFGLALGVNQGLFSMLPLYLATDRNLDAATANHYLALSRLVAFAMPLVAGWTADRFGLKQVLAIVVATSSIATLCVAIATAGWIAMGLVLQAMASVCFFPLGFAVLSRITDNQSRSMAVAFIMPIGHLVGAGFVPAFLGQAGDFGGFGMGIGILGGLTMLGMLLLQRIKLP